MNKRYFIFLFLVVVACAPKDKYNPAQYGDVITKNAVVPKIISFIYSAPAYTSMKDRFKPEHLPFYTSLAPKFTLYRYFIAADGTNFFYIIRPSSKIGDLRAVGGYFKIDTQSQLTGFREVFVTPVMPEAELKDRCLFLFDEMVKGTIAPYLAMPSYVQWPNEASSYDTVAYEWKLKPEALN